MYRNHQRSGPAKYDDVFSRDLGQERIIILCYLGVITPPPHLSQTPYVEHPWTSRLLSRAIPSHCQYCPLKHFNLNVLFLKWTTNWYIVALFILLRLTLQSICTEPPQSWPLIFCMRWCAFYLEWSKKMRLHRIFSSKFGARHPMLLTNATTRRRVVLWKRSNVMLCNYGWFYMVSNWPLDRKLGWKKVIQFDSLCYYFAFKISV